MYRKSEKAYILALLSLQIIAAVVQIMGKISGVESLNIGIQVYVFSFGIMLILQSILILRLEIYF